jgi:tryptophan-rich sensory protein
MSLFGFDQATSVAAWTAVALVCLPLSIIHSKRANTFYTNPEHMPSFAPRLGMHFVMWIIIGACWVVSMFYLTLVSVADSWQLITAMVLFLVHAILFKTWHMLFWKMNKARAAFVTGWLVVLTAVGLVICSFVDQTNAQRLYLIPGIIFSIYTGILLLNLLGNYYYIKKKHHSSRRREEFEDAMYEEAVDIPQRRGNAVTHYARRNGD